MIEHKLQYILVIFLINFYVTNSYNLERTQFIKDFIAFEERVTIIVSLLDLRKEQAITLSKNLNKANNQWINFKSNINDESQLDYGLYIIDLNTSNSTFSELKQAVKNKLLRIPARWFLFYKIRESEETTYNAVNSAKKEIEHLLEDVYVTMNTEVYVVFDGVDEFHLWLIHKIKPHLPLIWEEFAIWKFSSGFDRPKPEQALAMRRRDLQGESVVAINMMLHDSTWDEMPNYLEREKDPLPKLTYYMTQHLFEWVNGTGFVNRTSSAGNVVQDGGSSGMVGEMKEGRADFGGNPFIPIKNRVTFINYVLSPSPVEAMFIFKKPSLASVVNIYMLPFSLGVWLSSLGLISVMSLTLLLAYSKEEKNNISYGESILQKISDSFHNTLCLVFQQGTYKDPISLASRQILMLGLLAFMFLYTAYSANVVALLQSTTNDINSISTLLDSPLQCGAEKVEYIKLLFKYETRTNHKALVETKIAPQGDNAFLSIPEGIRKVREGMYAFHVILSSGYNQIQKTFLEEEKCNLGAIKYMSITYPYFGISANSHVKEQLRLGAFRLMESGVQDRSNRRVLLKAPRCAGGAMFAAVTLLDVAPALRCLLILYAVALLILGFEIVTHRREQRKQKCLLYEETSNKNTH